MQGLSGGRKVKHSSQPECLDQKLSQPECLKTEPKVTVEAAHR